MSVLSKALQLAVVVSLVNGCAANNTLPPVDQASDTSSLITDQTDTGAVASAETVSAEQLTTIAQSGLDLSVTKGAAETRLVIGTQNNDPKYEVFEMSEPARLVLDIQNTNTVTAGTYSVNDALVRSVRLGNHKGRTRVVLDLANAQASASDISRTINTENGQLTL